MRKLTKLILMSTVIVGLGALAYSPAAYADDYGASEKGEKKKHKRGHAIDTNGDGTVSKAEFLDAQEKRFDKMDADGNGNVTKEEMKAAHKAFKSKRENMREKREEMKDKRQERKNYNSDSE
jgi:Spy/CpxP family protein refolding chaperone